MSDPNPISFTVEKCDYNSVPLIVGGEVAKLGEFPHMVRKVSNQDNNLLKQKNLFLIYILPTLLNKKYNQ